VNGGEGNVDGVELIVARRRRHQPARRRHDADDLERLVPERDLSPDRVGVAEDALRRNGAEHDDLVGARLFARGEEAAGAESPRPADERQPHVGAVNAREPALVGALDVHVLMQPFGDVLYARQTTDLLRIRRRQRRRRAEPGLAVAEPLLGGRMIVLFHRVVFRMEREPEGRGAVEIPNRGAQLRLIAAPQRRRRLDRAAAEIVGRLHLVVAGGDDDQVHAGCLDLIFDRRFGAGADGDHRQDGADAYRHADNGEQRLEAVAAKGQQRDRERGA
jgi:hypothetical protein